MKKQVISYLRELSIVIFGISIAFAINKWSENIKNQEKELNILENIVSEIKHNKTYVESVIEANEIILLQYDSVINEHNSNDVIPSGLTLNVVKLFLQDTGTEMAISIGILSQVNFDIAREISYYHKLQKSMFQFETTYFNQLELAERTISYFNRTKNKLVNYTVALRSLQTNQDELLIHLEKYLNENLRNKN